LGARNRGRKGSRTPGSGPYRKKLEIGRVGSEGFVNGRQGILLLRYLLLQLLLDGRLVVAVFSRHGREARKATETRVSEIERDRVEEAVEREKL
ncbi:hypothetical protein BHE74_00056954, partial [Ensete ventricosum]